MAKIENGLRRQGNPVKQRKYRKARQTLNRRLGLQALESRRLLVGDDQFSEAIPAAFGLNSDDLNALSDVDIWSISLTVGETIGIDLDSPDFVDTVLRVFDDSGASGFTEIGFSDDDRGPDNEFSNVESFVLFTAPATDVYYIGVSSFGNDAYNPVTGTGAVDGTVKTTRAGSNPAPFVIRTPATELS